MILAFSLQDSRQSTNSKVLGIKEFHVAKALLEGQQEQLPEVFFGHCRTQSHPIPNFLWDLLVDGNHLHLSLSIIQCHL